MRRFVLQTRDRAQAFAASESASAAVEFAAILPLAVLLLFGSIDITDGVTARRKLALATSTVADLVSQQQTLDQAHADSMFQVAQAIMAPYDVGSLATVVSSVVVDANGQATVAWSLASSNGTQRVKGSVFPLADGLRVPNTSVVVSELSYTYRPTVGYRIGTLALTDIAAVPPRSTSLATPVACTATGC